jgi:NIMA (never in mitosis gene a)-related kinase
MNMLFKRVCEGRIPPLPPMYSKDLMYMIKLCLQVDPKLRPNCSEMLAKSQLLRNTPSALSLAIGTDEDL